MYTIKLCSFVLINSQKINLHRTYLSWLYSNCILVVENELLILVVLLTMLLGYYSVGKEENSANFLFTVFTVVGHWMWCCKFLIRVCGKICIVVGLVSQMGTFFSSICSIFISLELGRGYGCIFLFLGLYIFLP